MGKPKKTNYTETEKKGLSQARNLGTDRELRKIKEHANVTGHKVYLLLLVVVNDQREKSIVN
jgi:hypothetical protein